MLILGAALFLALSCEKSSPAILVPPPTDPLVKDFLGFGVITDSFTHIRKEPGERSPSLGYVRKGSLVRIAERRSTPEEGGSWLFVDYRGGEHIKGWINESLVETYDNESRALTASEALTP